MYYFESIFMVSYMKLDSREIDNAGSISHLDLESGTRNVKFSLAS